MEINQIAAKANQFIDALHTLEAGTKDDVRPLVDLFAIDAKLTNSALDNQDKEIEGGKSILRFWWQYKELLGDVQSKFHYVTVSSNAAGLFWTTTGTNPAGDEVNYHGATLLVFNAEGKITFLRGYYDTLELDVKAPQ